MIHLPIYIAAQTFRGDLELLSARISMRHYAANFIALGANAALMAEILLHISAHQAAENTSFYTHNVACAYTTAKASPKRRQCEQQSTQARAVAGASILNIKIVIHHFIRVSAEMPSSRKLPSICETLGQWRMHF